MRITSPAKFGALVKDTRKKMNLTQEDLEKKTGINQATISLLESGNSATKLKTILVLMSALDLEMDISPRVKTELKGDEW